MNRYSVITLALNLRSTPTSSDSFNVLDILSFQTVVEVLDKNSSNWWRINTISSGLLGFVAARFLEPVEDSPIMHEIIPNTLNILSTKLITTFISDRNTWKATFEQYFDRLPNHISEIAWIALTGRRLIILFYLEPLDKLAACTIGSLCTIQHK